MAKQVLAILNPLADGDTVLVKNRSGCWQKCPATGTLIPLNAALGEATLLEVQWFSSAIWAFPRYKGVNHRCFPTVSHNAVAFLIVRKMMLF